MAKTYFINLDRRTDRREAIMQQAKRLSLEITRISAVDAKDLTLEQIPQYLHQARDCSGSFYRGLTINEMAIIMSHRRCWQLISEHPQGVYGIILEDDAKLKNGFADVFEFLDLLRGRCHLIYLTSSPIDPALHDVRHRIIDKVGSFDLVEYQRNPVGAYGYALSPSFARMLLEVNSISSVLEHMIINTAWDAQVRSYGIAPNQSSVSRDADLQAKGDNARSMKKDVKRSLVKLVLYRLGRRLKMMRHHYPTHGFKSAIFWPKSK